jgi:hypothetical protein
MKKMIIALLLTTPFLAHAETELACWDKYAPRGAKPILKAHIEADNTLSNLTLDLKNEKFQIYYEDKSVVVDNQIDHTVSTLENPTEAVSPEEITSNRSPYKGNNEYSFVMGSWFRTAPYGNYQGQYRSRLILPKDLSNEFLRTYHIRGTTERSNAVMIYSPSVVSDQGGDNYLRMFCTSK